MYPEDVIALALENVVGKERQKKRQMELSLSADQVALQEKEEELSMLKRKNQGMLAKEAAKEELVDDFMVFVTAIENNNLETAQNFDEKEMMDTIATMMNSDACDNGGFTGGYGDYNLPGIDLSLEEKAAIDAIFALKNGAGCGGGGSGGFAGSHEGINNAPENAHHGEEDKMIGTEGTKCDGGDASNAGGHGGNYNRNRGKQGDCEDKMTATGGTKCDGGEASTTGGHGGKHNGNRRDQGDGGSQ